MIGAIGFEPATPPLRSTTVIFADIPVFRIQLYFNIFRLILILLILK